MKRKCDTSLATPSLVFCHQCVHGVRVILFCLQTGTKSQHASRVKGEPYATGWRRRQPNDERERERGGAWRCSETRPGEHNQAVSAGGGVKFIWTQVAPEQSHPREARVRLDQTDVKSLTTQASIYRLLVQAHLLDERVAYAVCSKSVTVSGGRDRNSLCKYHHRQVHNTV